MANYTMRLEQVLTCTIIDNLDNLEDKYPDTDFETLTNPMMYSGVDENVRYGREGIFDFDYPIFDEAYREALETKFLTQNYMREIGAETIGQWKLMLRNRLNMVMPYYNQLYESERVKYNPLMNHEHYETNDATKRQDDTHDFTGNVQGSLDSSTSGTSHMDTTENGSYNKDGAHSDDGSASGKRTTTGTFSLDGSGSDNTTRNLTGGGTSKGESNGKKDVETDENTTTSNSQSGSSSDYYNDTPQGGVENLNDLSYLTRAEKHSNSSSGSGTSKTTGTQSETTSASESGETTKQEDETVKRDTTEKRAEDTSGTEDTEDTTHTEGTWDEKGTDTRTTVQDGRTTGKRDDRTTQDTINKDVGHLDSTENYIRHFAGKSGTETYQEMLMKWRNSFLNIDQMVMKELDCLFMGLWQ